MNIALITGIYGQDAHYLTELLITKGYTIYGITHKLSFDTMPNVHVIYCDITSTSDIIKVFNKISDDNNDIDHIKVLEIYNLAAQSSVAISYQYPEYTMNINAMAVLKILEAIRLTKLEKKIRMFNASTSELFGNNPIHIKSEKTAFEPLSPYGISKLFAHNIVKNYRDTYNLFVCSGILFNHESPKRKDVFVTKKITKAIGNIIKGHQKELVVGNIYVKRDWGHAEDSVRAMWLMLQSTTPKDYVIATGEQHSVKEFIILAFKCVGIELEWIGEGINEVAINKANNEIIIRISAEYFRKNELFDMIGDSSLICKDLGWKPQISFEQLVSEMISTSF